MTLAQILWWLIWPLRQQKSKRFFFEKKKQKTFIHDVFIATHSHHE